MNEPFISGFLKTLRILKDYLSVIVIGGGWVPVIYYRFYKPFTKISGMVSDIHQKSQRLL